MAVAGSEGARDPSGRSGAEEGEPIGWSSTASARSLARDLETLLQRQRHRHAGARRCPHQYVVLFDRSPRRRSGLSVGRLVRDCCALTQMQSYDTVLLDIVIAKQASCRHHSGARWRYWQVFMKSCDKPRQQPRSTRMESSCITGCHNGGL